MSYKSSRYRATQWRKRWGALEDFPAWAGGEANWWDPNGDGLCIWAAYQPKGAANQAASYVDLSGNGNNAGVGVAPGWDAVNGWKFAGTNQYLTTTFIHNRDQTQTMIVQFTNVGNNGYLCGAYTGANYWWIGPNIAAIGCRYANGGIQNVAPALLAGTTGTIRR